MSYNSRVQSFTNGSTTFTASGAQGVYVEEGDAGGPSTLDRISVNGAGAVHDLDGTASAALVPPVLEQAFIFQAANPGAHTQYNNLLALVGEHGTLTLSLPGASSTTTTTVTARLLGPLQGKWTAPHAQGKQNTMMIRARWQLKGFPA